MFETRVLPCNDADVCLVQSLLQKSLLERRQILQEHFQPVPGEFDFAKSSDGDATEAIQTFLEESVKDGCEGLMIKILDTQASHYEPSRRSVNWLKVSARYFAAEDTDVHVCAAEEGLSCGRW